MENNPYISVVITAYNRKEFLLDAFNSALNQTLSKDKYEIIVTKNFTDDKIDGYIKKNGGKLVFFEKGNIGEQIVDALKYASGEVICFLEDDDLFTKEKLHHVYNIFSKNVNLGYIHNSEYFIDKNGKKINTKINRYEKNKSFVLMNKDKKILKLIKAEQDYNPIFNPSSIAIRKLLLINYLRYLKNLKANQDGFMYFVALNSDFDLYFTNKKLTYYRLHSSTSISFDSYKNFKERLVQLFEYTMYSLKPLLGIFVKKPVKLYLEYWLREREIFYYFHKGNFRIKVFIDLIKNSPYMIPAIPKRFLMRCFQVTFYIIWPNKFRNFDFNYNKKILKGE